MEPLRNACGGAHDDRKAIRSASYITPHVSGPSGRWICGRCVSWRRRCPPCMVLESPIESRGSGPNRSRSRPDDERPYCRGVGSGFSVERDRRVQTSLPALSGADVPSDSSRDFERFIDLIEIRSWRFPIEQPCTKRRRRGATRTIVEGPTDHDPSPVESPPPLRPSSPTGRGGRHPTRSFRNRVE